MLTTQLSNHHLYDAWNKHALAHVTKQNHLYRNNFGNDGNENDKTLRIWFYKVK